MYVDGKALAEKIYEDIRIRVASLRHAPTLTIITCAPNFETQKYLALKMHKAKQVGITTCIIELSKESTTEDFVTSIAAQLANADGIIVQLPLPPHVDTEKVLQAVPVTHDIDALNRDTTEVLSPVVGAIAEILKIHEVPIFERHVTVIGSGKLVGIPASRWFMERGSAVSVVTKDTIDISYYTKNADIIVSGAGVPGLIVPDMIKEGVVILDAGTSEEGGILRGDAHPDCEKKASLITPVPGGIGPITVAVLLRNLIELAKVE